MNRKQTVIFWIAIVLITLIGLYPPQVQWSVKTYGPGVREGMVWGEKHHVDTGRLLGYWIAVGAVAGAFIYTLRDRKETLKK